MVSAIHRELLSAHFSTDSLVNCGGPGTLDKGQPGKHMGFGQPPWICLATLLMSQIGTDPGHEFSGDPRIQDSINSKPTVLQHKPLSLAVESMAKDCSVMEDAGVLEENLDHRMSGLISS